MDINANVFVFLCAHLPHISHTSTASAHLPHISHTSTASTHFCLQMHCQCRAHLPHIYCIYHTQALKVHDPFLFANAQRVRIYRIYRTQALRHLHLLRNALQVALVAQGSCMHRPRPNVFLSECAMGRAARAAPRDVARRGALGASVMKKKKAKHGGWETQKSKEWKAQEPDRKRKEWKERTPIQNRRKGWPAMNRSSGRHKIGSRAGKVKTGKPGKKSGKQSKQREKLWKEWELYEWERHLLANAYCIFHTHVVILQQEIHMPHGPRRSRA